MSENLYKVLSFENDMAEGFYNHKDEKYLVNIIEKINKVLPKLNNQEIMYLLKNGDIIHEYTNGLLYLKKYKINKTELKKENSYKEELRKLNNFIDLVYDAAYNDAEYRFICDQCDIDNTADYLISKMTNEDIMALANESKEWDYKLFLYGKLKS